MRPISISVLLVAALFLIGCNTSNPNGGIQWSFSELPAAYASEFGYTVHVLNAGEDPAPVAFIVGYVRNADTGALIAQKHVAVNKTLNKGESDDVDLSFGIIDGPVKAGVEFAISISETDPYDRHDHTSSIHLAIQQIP